MVLKFGKVPLERALSKLGIASRSQTKAWVLNGRLKINGRLIKDPLYLVTPEKDKFYLDGELIELKSFQTIIFNKPKAVVTTKNDEHGRRTVFDFLPSGLQHLHAVGRLDMASTGLLILTNDTKLSSFLTDPSNAIKRSYVVTVKGRLTDEKIQIASQGVLDAGELLKPSKMTLLKASGKESHCIVELTEGKNREIRRLFKAIGNEVTALKRFAFGPINLDKLAPGAFRHLSKDEINNLTSRL